MVRFMTAQSLRQTLDACGPDDTVIVWFGGRLYDIESAEPAWIEREAGHILPCSRDGEDREAAVLIELASTSP